MKNFTVYEKLGEGSYSSVLRVKRTSDQQEYAMKKVHMGQLKEKEKENSLNEIRILASITHPSIVAYKEAFYDESQQNLCIVMEYADQGDLHQRIKTHVQQKHYVPEVEIWKMLYQITTALKTLHLMNILHRDLKSANVFIHQGNYKLGDMNVSKVAKKGLVYTQTGTPYYASPEVWRDQPYDAKSDIWGLGCVTYEMSALKPPFRSQNMEGLFKKVQKGLYERIPSKYTNDLQAIIGLCLQVSPKARPSCLQLLSNPIFIKNTRQFDRDSQSRVSQQSQSDSLQTNVLLSTIKLPKNMRLLKEKLPRSKYEEQTNKSFEDSIDTHVNSSFLPKIHQQVKANFSVPPMKSKVDSERPNNHSSLHQEQSKDRRRILLEQERARQRRAQAIKISVVQQNAIPYNNNSSAQLQNLYMNKQQGEHREQREQIKPVWWG